MDIVFDGELRTLGFHDPEADEVQLMTLGVDEGGFGVELGEDAYLGVDEDDAFAQLSLRAPEDPAARLSQGEAAAVLLECEGAPEAELAEAEWDVDRPLRWRLDGGALTVLVDGRARSQWARIGASGLAVALDLEQAGEAWVAALVHRGVTSDPGFERLALEAGE